MKANGKADLYFHAYFWDRYIQQLNDAQKKPSVTVKPTKAKKVNKKQKTGDAEEEEEKAKSEEDEPVAPVPNGEKIEVTGDKYLFMRRLQGLSATLAKVIVNIKKFPFNETTYKKFVDDFAQR
jgi:hypothetical protein